MGQSFLLRERELIGAIQCFRYDISDALFIPETETISLCIMLCTTAKEKPIPAASSKLDMHTRVCTIQEEEINYQWS